MDYYMPTRPYFVLDAKETAELQREAGDLRAITDDPKASWVERSRAAERLQTIERELQVSRTAERMAGHAAPPPRSAPAAVNAAAEPQYAEPVPYFAEPGHAAPMVGNAVPWPEDFVARTELLSAAVAEVRRLKLLEKPA